MKTNILIAVPCYNNNATSGCVTSLLNLSEKLAAAGMLKEFMFTASSMLTEARNLFANRVLHDGDKSGRPFSHLLFIDADGAFDADAVLSLINVNKPIVALPFSAKFLNWDAIAKAARAGVPAEKLREFGGVPLFRTEDTLALHDQLCFTLGELSPVRRIGCGVMLVQRDVFRALAEAHPEWRYKIHPPALYGPALPVPNRDFAFNFFQTQICPQTKFLLGEDYFFVEQDRLLGFPSYMLPQAHTIHTGNFDYVLNLSALTALASLAATGAMPEHAEKQTA